MPPDYAVVMTDELAFRSTIVNPKWMSAWSVIEVPGSEEFFGTGKSVRANVTVEGVAVTSALMPTGRGYHFISVSAALRKKLGKDVGDEVDVRIAR
jgi:hypothetical protein